MPNLSSDPLDILIASDSWATRLLLTRCSALSRDQFHQRFDIGLGSLHDNFVHIISVMRRWTDRLAGRTPRPVLKKLAQFPHLGGDDRDRPVDELLSLLAEAESDLKAVRQQCRDTLHTTISVDWPGDDGKPKRYTFTRGTVFVHLCTHGFHHRAQCLNMLKHLKVPGLSDKLPDPSTVDWQADVESPPVVV